MFLTKIWFIVIEMRSIIFMKTKIFRGLIAGFVFCFLVISVLAFSPHYTCGCGQTEDGTQLTRIINAVSEKITGKPIFEKSKKSL